jgi:hypothetical protein
MTLESEKETESQKFLKDDPTIRRSACEINDDKAALPQSRTNTTTTLTRNADEDLSIRHVLGSGTSTLSSLVNEHLSAARLAAMVSIGLLAAYGVLHSPLFFRYSTVADLPRRFFTRRKNIPCRLVNVECYQPNKPIILLLRHLSPFERLVFLKSSSNTSKSMFYSWFATTHAKDNPSQLLRVELAGVQAPPVPVDDWLEQFVQQKPIVQCECFGRRVAIEPEYDDTTAISTVLRRKRPIPKDDWMVLNEASASRRGPNQIAVCRIHFRNKFLQLFPNDLAETVVKNGRACLRQGGSLYARDNDKDNYLEHDTCDTLVDVSDSVDYLRKDAEYSTNLSSAEFEAARGFHGIWSNPDYRESRADVTAEIDFQTTASVWKKLWRYIRGG